jgi:hypothetical protein
MLMMILVVGLLNFVTKPTHVCGKKSDDVRCIDRFHWLHVTSADLNATT